jgi:hypothetical protein
MSSDLPNSSVLVDQLEKSAETACPIPHRLLMQALEGHVQPERMPLELLGRLVNIACDQGCRWYSMFLCSPNENRHEVARQEAELWIATWAKWAETSWCINPALQAIDERMIDGKALLEVTQINIGDWKKRPVRRVTVHVFGGLARRLHNVGIKSLAGRLANIAMFPPGSFGRRNEVLMPTSLAERIRRRSNEEFVTLETMARGGDADAQVQLGNCYKHGTDVPRDYAKAVELYRKAATRGFPGAEYNLALMHLDGLGCQQDDTAAAEWFHKAAEQGYLPAQTNLAWMFLKGRGVAQDDVRSVSWYRRAAEQGESRAVVRVGVAYSEGTGVPCDLAEAYKWTLIASALGDTDQEEVDRVNELIAAYQREVPADQLDEGQLRAKAWLADFQSRTRR